MTDTHEDWQASLDLEADTFRNQLVGKGFVDDGKLLHGKISWNKENQLQSAEISVEITSRYPFAPPKVRILNSDIEPTFHIERNDGSPLCLWTSDVAIDHAPWKNVDKFLNWVSGWFSETENGWPDDNDADLERYLETDGRRFLAYVNEDLQSGRYYRTKKTSEDIYLIVEELPWRPNTNRMKNRGIRRRERGLCYVMDVGQVNIPIRNWTDLMLVTGNDLHTVRRLIELGSVEYLLVKYRRCDTSANLMIGFNKAGDLKAYESADSSKVTRALRGGDQAKYFAKKKVIIIGCGAIGSYVAETLHRSGVQSIMLVDPERLRPGNVIRHLCGDEYIGKHKVVAVREKLASLGLDPSKIRVSDTRIGEPEETLRLLTGYDVIVDATADMRATAMLQFCSEVLGSKLVSICLQREGGIARVDRFPLWDDEQHLVVVPNLPGAAPAFENGCGSPVSKTPPLSVIKAAALGSQVILDEISMYQQLPATLLEVINIQPDAPYDTISLLTS